MDKISKALKCAECREILRSPVILPCGLSVCKHHTEAKSSFYCMSCADEHSSPRGFPSNKALEEMIAAEIQELDLGKEHKLALDLCAQLDTTIEKLASAYENPELYIHEKMSSLKNKVDLKRELLKLRIDEIADKMIEKVVKYEDECVTHSKSSSFKTDFEEVDDKVKSAKDDCKKWSANLNRLRVDVVDFENTSKKCAGLIGTLEKKFLEIDSVLLMGKALTFQHEIETFENFEIRFNFNNNLGLDFKFNNDEFGVKNIKEEKFDRTRSILQDLEYPRFEERSNLRSLGANGTEFGTELSSDEDLEDEVDFSPISRTRSQLLTPRDRSTSRLLGFDEFYTYTPPRTTDEATKTPVGRYRSRGSANGRPVYRGPRGGLFYLNSSGFKQYVTANQVELDE